MMRRIEVIGVEGMPEIRPGDDLAALFLEALRKEGISLQDYDVVVFASKVVAKSEGRIVDLSGVKPDAAAEKLAAITGKDPRIVQLILSDAAEIICVGEDFILTETKHGFICANAGIDESNVEHGKAVLLPEDPQRSAATLRRKIEAATGKKIAVLLADSCGRPFRIGVAGTCVGFAGMKPTLDRRGEKDRFGKTARITIVAIADEICAAANLVMGELQEGIPAVIVRGLRFKLDEEQQSVKTLFFDKRRDVFRTLACKQHFLAVKNLREGQNTLKS